MESRASGEKFNVKKSVCVERPFSGRHSVQCGGKPAGKAKGKGCALPKGSTGPVVRSERETTWPGTRGHPIVFTFREARVAELGQTVIDPERARSSFYVK